MLGNRLQGHAEKKKDAREETLLSGWHMKHCNGKKDKVILRTIFRSEISILFCHGQEEKSARRKIGKKKNRDVMQITRRLCRFVSRISKTFAAVSVCRMRVSRR